MFRSMKKYFASLPAASLNFITVVSGFITIVSAIVMVLTFILKILGVAINQNQLYKFFNKHGVLFYAICLTIFSILVTIKVFKYRKVQMETRRAISESYYGFLGKIRDTVGDFRVLQNDDKPVDKKLVTTMTKSACDVALDNLVKIFRVLCRADVSACIKLVNKSKDDVDRFVVTFARSSNSAEKRIANDEATNKDYIKDNTDFNNIIENKELYFYQMDLLKYAEDQKSVGNEYRNSTPNWEELYRATIVAPIKIANRRAHDTDKESEYAVTGFLCIDSMNTHIFVPAQKDYYIKILKSYASLLYTLFSLYRDILKETT